MPDDLFTACLTTPLRVSLWFHNLQTFPLTASDSGKSIERSSAYMTALYENMSQGLKDRLCYELQAIMHTIAWQTLDGPDYQMVFGQSGDVVSSMAGGFLLSQRVMATYRAIPESIPWIPSSTSHALWSHWDLILDNLFEQLPSFAHFEDRLGDTSWEDGLKLLSFMDDQLESILGTLVEVDVHRGETMAPGLSRLPIICQAALTAEFRQRACTALDSCLRNLDISGLARAVQGGALDVAGHLLAAPDPAIATRIISIWAALVRNDTCVKSLGAEGRTAERLTSVPCAERLTSVPCVRFFLDSLEENLDRVDCKTIVIQTSAVLATIANFVAGRKAPRFSTRTLKTSVKMMQSDDGLVQQWGALLVAEVLGCIDQSSEVDPELISTKAQLVSMTISETVESRATAVYALSRLVPRQSVGDLKALAPLLEMVQPLVDRTSSEGSALVRKELARLFHRILHASSKWAAFAYIVVMLEHGSIQLPEEKEACAAFVVEAGKTFGQNHGLRIPCGRLAAIVRVVDSLQRDLLPSVSGLARAAAHEQVSRIKHFADDSLEMKTWEALSTLRREQDWTTGLVREVRETGRHLLRKWEGSSPQDLLPLNNELFERSKQSLRAYLSVRRNSTGASLTYQNQDISPSEKQDGKLETPHERTWKIRHRFIEDSLVLAEQQSMSSKRLAWLMVRRSSLAMGVEIDRKPGIMVAHVLPQLFEYDRRVQ